MERSLTKNDVLVSPEYRIYIAEHLKNAVQERIVLSGLLIALCTCIPYFLGFPLIDSVICGLSVVVLMWYEGDIDKIYCRMTYNKFQERITRGNFKKQQSVIQYEAKVVSILSPRQRLQANTDLLFDRMILFRQNIQKGKDFNIFLKRLRNNHLKLHIDSRALQKVEKLNNLINKIDIYVWIGWIVLLFSTLLVQNQLIAGLFFVFLLYMRFWIVEFYAMIKFKTIHKYQNDIIVELDVQFRHLIKVLSNEQEKFEQELSLLKNKEDFLNENDKKTTNENDKKTTNENSAMNEIKEEILDQMNLRHHEKNSTSINLTEHAIVRCIFAKKLLKQTTDKLISHYDKGDVHLLAKSA